MNRRPIVLCMLSIVLGLLITYGIVVPAAAQSSPAVGIEGTSKVETISVGFISDEAGVNDNGVNWYSYQGLLRAESELGVTGTVYTPTNPTEYEQKIQQCLSDGNDLCISSGFLLSDATMNVATANPGTNFAIVDTYYEMYPDNLRGIQFNIVEAGYLAGTLAGLMTESDVIGTIGGFPIPPVYEFIDGYRNGAQCSNPDVDVLIEYAYNWNDPELGASIAQDMIAQGGDVLFGVAGPTGISAILTGTQSGAWGIGIDFDFYPTVFDNGAIDGADKLLSSALKRTDNAVFDTISDVISGTFTAGTEVYNLSVDGVGLAPFHEADSSVPQGVRDTLANVEQGIIDGTININETCRKSIGFIPDEAGVNDMGFNWYSYQGLLRAESELGLSGTVYTPADPTDYESKLQQCVSDGNILCISTGFLLADATMNVATAYSSTNFAIVDYLFNAYPDNLQGIQFAEDEAGYLAGTLAGLMTESDVIGAIGGMEIDSVVSYVEGYRNGAQASNPNVEVLVEYAGNFGDPELGATIAQGMIAQGGDVLFGVGGTTGNSAILTATQSGVWGIGVDFDFYTYLFENGAVEGADKLLSSAEKHFDNAVFDTISDVISGTFTSGTKVYDLSVDGVGLAPYHEADASVPQSVRETLAAVKQGIIDGTIIPIPTKVYLPMISR